MTTKAPIPTAEVLMNRKVKTVTPEMPLHELIVFLLENQVSCAPVVEEGDESRHLVGFVSEADALDRVSNSMFYGTPRPPETVQTCMKRHPVTVSPDIDAFTLASLFVNHGYRHLPVVDDAHQLLGLVSRRDILQAVHEFLQAKSAEYESEHFRPDLQKIINHRFIVSR